MKQKLNLGFKLNIDTSFFKNMIEKDNKTSLKKLSKEELSKLPKEVKKIIKQLRKI